MSEAKTKESYIAAWEAHVRQLKTLAFQANASIKEAEKVFHILGRWVFDSANNSFDPPPTTEGDDHGTT